MKSIIRRTILIAFFVGFNFALGIYFLSQFQYPLPTFASQFLTYFKIIPANYLEKKEYSLTGKTPDLSADGVLVQMNAVRTEASLEPLTQDNDLEEAAKILLDEYRKHNFDVNKVDAQALERSLKSSGYSYAWVGNNLLIGPLFNDQVTEALKSDPEQLKTLKNKDFTEVGIAASIESLYGSDIGVVVQLLAQPQQEKKQVKVLSASTEPAGEIAVAGTTPVDVSDQEVINSLNSYRLAHGVSPLNTNENLCSYAEKRVQDLVAFGNLDGHEGFRKDFEKPETLPQSIREYKGTSIGENLAHQYCKNMTTGESFVAQTGTALIEWCFDSSTKGHREAQLSPDFKNVCVRHGKNMYVVIFGN